MNTLKNRLISFIVFGAMALTLTACGGSLSSSSPVILPAATAQPADVNATDGAIRFLEDRVKRDPDDFIACNKLAGYYFQRLRETGSVTYLDLASRAARTSLAAMPAEQNVGGLYALARSEFSSHDFGAARDHAMQLAKLDSGKAYPLELLGDALIELGQYDDAMLAYEKMKQLDGTGFSSEVRLANFEALHGNNALALKRYTSALELALDTSTPQRESVAWCRWQLGETAFSLGNYDSAEQYYSAALATYPDYFRALASLGRVRAAKGDLQGAIGFYERAVRIIPDPSFVAALGDLYLLAGREQDARAQYALVEQIGHLSALNGQLYNRQLALFYADHDLTPDEAYANASGEYAVRKDIYGADAVAWTALKAGKIAEARAAVAEALKLGTQDARLLYHAGMIALAANDSDAARQYLSRALTLNPQFDPLQAPKARQALDGLSN